MIRDDKLIGDYLRAHGDIIYFKMIYGEFIDLTTHIGIDIFFAKIEEFVDKDFESFDVDAFLNMNSWMVTYYINDPENKKIPMPSYLYGDRVSAVFAYPSKPSFEYLLSYLRLSNEMCAFVTKKINPTVQHIINPDLIRVLPKLNPFITFVEADTEVVDWTIGNLSLTKHEQMFDSNQILLLAWLKQPAQLPIRSTMQLPDLWNMLIFNSYRNKRKYFESESKNWWYLLILKLQKEPKIYSIFNKKLKFLDKTLDEQS